MLQIYGLTHGEIFLLASSYELPNKSNKSEREWSDIMRHNYVSIQSGWENIFNIRLSPMGLVVNVSSS